MKIRIQIKRKIIQIIALALTNPHVANLGSGRLYKGRWKNFCSPGLNCYSCPAAGLSCPIGALQAVNGSIDFQWSFYVIGLLCAFGILLGRAVCGFLCPFGLLQEILYKIPFPKKKIPHGAKYIKYGMLAAIVLLLPAVITNAAGMGEPFFCKFICPAGMIEGGIPLLITQAGIRAMAGKLFVLKAVIAAAVVVGCLVNSRFFCKVLCPLGAFYGFFNKISFVQLKTDCKACISCGECSRICPMDVDPSKHPNSMECIRCGKCIEACKKNAIAFQKVKKQSTQTAER